jgi:hypothetical protein
MKIFKSVLVLSVLMFLPSLYAQKGSQDKSGEKKALEAIERCVKALGGTAFLQVKDMKSSGKYYQFRKGENTLPIMYQDYTRLPDKSRYETGKGKNRDASVFDLAARKGWILEAGKGVREANKEEIDSFKKAVKHAIENVLRTRYKEPGVKLFYFGPEQVTSKKRAEAVQLLDEENDEVTIYIDLSNNLPLKLEYTEALPDGRKLKIEEEYSNWHSIQGVMTPLRIDTFADGNQASQRFIEKISYNNNFPDSLFGKPQVEK